MKQILWRFSIRCSFIISQITSSGLLTIISMRVSFCCKSAFTIRSKDCKKTSKKSTAEIVEFYFCRMLRKWLSHWTHCCYNGKKNRLTYAETPFTSLNDTTCRSNNRLLAKHWCTNSFRKWMIKPRLWAAFQKVFPLFGLMDSGGSVPVQSRHLRKETHRANTFKLVSEMN